MPSPYPLSRHGDKTYEVSAGLVVLPRQARTTCRVPLPAVSELRAYAA